MRIRIEVSADEGHRARAFYDLWSSNPYVRLRQERNVDRTHKVADECEFWDALVSALLTTQQRSGPSSSVSKFINTSPFPLGLIACRTHRPCGRHVEQTITAFGGIRRGPTIAAQLQANLEWLEDRGWGLVLSRLSTLESGAPREIEREVARYLDAELKGLGPKQARNVLQMLGLVHYETPIDSRTAKWLKEFGFPVELSGMALTEAPVYEFVLDGFQVLCERAGVLPCLMDAAIFASFDGSAWDKAEIGRW